MAAYVILDDADYDRFHHYRWLAQWSVHTKSYYPYRFELLDGRTVHVLLGREILGLPRNPGRATGQEVDYINGDTLDNTRANLRVATRSQNMANRRRNRNAKCDYRGVSAANGQWRASIYFNRNQIYLGTFSTSVLAAIAYNHAARLLHGEFASLNELPKTVNQDKDTHVDITAKVDSVLAKAERAIMARDSRENGVDIEDNNCERRGVDGVEYPS